MMNKGICKDFFLITLITLFFSLSTGCQKFDDEETEALRSSVDDKIAEVNNLSKSIQSQVKDIKQMVDSLRAPSQVSVLSSLFFSTNKKKINQIHDKLTLLEEDLFMHKEKKLQLEIKVKSPHFKAIYREDLSKASYDKDKIFGKMEKTLDELKEVERDYQDLGELNFDISSLLKIFFKGASFFESSRVEALRFRYEDILTQYEEEL